MTQERGVRLPLGLARTLLAALADAVGVTDLPANGPLVPWAVRHAAWLHAHYVAGPDGKTPHLRLVGKPYRSPIAQFGEKVHYLGLGTLKEPGRDKGSSRWGEGHFLGIRNETGEILIGNAEGVVKARDFKRIADPEQRWNAESFKKMRGSPGKPNPEV